MVISRRWSTRQGIRGRATNVAGVDEQQSDSWSPDSVSGLGESSGKEKGAPDTLGGAGMARSHPAPERYVREQ
jgi:hypothetical protein